MSIPAMNLMTALRSGHATSPRLTWYGPDSERIELSGRVLDNWVAKTANLLQDELDAGPGISLRLELPAHWKSLVWALAAWQLGMELVLDGGPADLLATSSPGDNGSEDAGDGATAGFDAVVAVPLAALAMRWPGALPPGVLDYAAEVRSHGDVFMPYSEAEPGLSALRLPGRGFSHGELLTGFATAGPAAGEGAHDEGSRILVRAGDGLDAALAEALGCWDRGGSIVLVHPDVEVTEHLLQNERVSGA
ncbi:TIGR03089 family protein [Arthrobacter celericrescens]|uniref:TIGR03089 family protein n=1 Tax=Arthrobacter celericrescens TaxID=2320851 RepID=UPI000EA2B152|nr:TIGR03089 family protein [Arthrobacter celericrescens]